MGRKRGLMAHVGCLSTFPLLKNSIVLIVPGPPNVVGGTISKYPVSRRMAVIVPFPCRGHVNQIATMTRAIAMNAPLTTPTHLSFMVFLRTRAGFARRTARSLSDTQ